MKRGAYMDRTEPRKLIKKKVRHLFERGFDWIALVAIALLILSVLVILNL
ncbi:hypothetical protein [Spirosoma fluminis]